MFNIREVFLLVVCILTRPTGSSKYGTTRKNIHQYYTPKHLIRYVYVVNQGCVTCYYLDHGFHVVRRHRRRPWAHATASHAASRVDH